MCKLTPKVTKHQFQQYTYQEDRIINLKMNIEELLFLHFNNKFLWFILIVSSSMLP